MAAMMLFHAEKCCHLDNDYTVSVDVHAAQCTVHQSLI